jgi:amidase
MISQNDYLRLDAMAIAALIKSKAVSPSEVLEAAIQRAEAVNGALGAITIPMYEIARARAKGRLEGPLAGVPFLIKDLFQDYAGVLATSGCRALRNARNTPSQHSEIVRRWLAAGTVIFGRTNTPEFGAKGITEPVAWGPTHNPWSLERSPGGSSGGSAAAVAAGIVPVAGASDGGGSIRIPAASTGLFGLKPGRGRTPNGPGVAEVMHGGAVNHVISRTVRDSACFLDAVHGPELGSPLRIESPPRPYVEEVGRDPGRLRIAFSGTSPLGTAVDPEIASALEQTARRLEGMGHIVEPAEPAIDGMLLARDFLLVWFANLAYLLEQTRVQTGSSDFELDTRAMAELARGKSSAEYAASYWHWNGYGYALAQFMERYDLFLTPTLALPPPVIGTLATPPWAAAITKALLPIGLGRLLSASPKVVERIILENLRRVPFTQLANITGVPAMSVPLHRFADGLPLGMQFLAAHGGEGMLLRVAAQLEDETWTIAPAFQESGRERPSRVPQPPVVHA